MLISPVLKERLQHRQCVAFVGAGFSMVCGMPNWHSLVAALLEEARGSFLSPETSDALTACDFFLRHGSLAMAANFLRDALPPGELDRMVRERFSISVFHGAQAPKKRQMTSRLKSLVVGPWAGILTTNYDELIEYGLNRWKRSSTVITTEVGLGSALCVPPSPGFFFAKIHGSMAGDRIVLSSDEYDRVYLGVPRVCDFLSAVMLRYHLLFLGCSLEDEIVRIRRRLVVEYEGRIPTAFALLPRSEENIVRAPWLRTRAAIEPLLYSVPRGSHQAVDRFLAEAAKIDVVSGGENLDTRAELRRLPVGARVERVGAVNRSLLALVAQQPRHALLHLSLMSLVDIKGRVLRSLCDISPEERAYRVFFLVSIGLLREEHADGGARSYKIPAAVTKVLRDGV